MRAFINSQCDAFLNAFGQSMTSTGITFTGIKEVVPVSIDTGGGFIESTETHVTIKKQTLTTTGIAINSVLNISGTDYIIYNIVDDLSGMVDLYVRTVASQSFAEDY